MIANKCSERKRLAKVKASVVAFERLNQLLRIEAGRMWDVDHGGTVCVLVCVAAGF